MKTILILIDHFYPAYKGGGPIQSISNLILALEGQYKIHVITSAYDLRSKDSMDSVIPNEWNKVILPQSNKPIMVWYSQKRMPTYNTFKKLLAETKPGIIYMNGIFSYHLFMIPLVVIRNIHSTHKVVICPRGMLQKGALADKALKKQLYLRTLKFSGFINKAVWHATNKEEEDDILKQFGNNAKVIIAMNIPKLPVKRIYPIEKRPGDLKLIYLSLIAEKKNLLLLLQLIRATENISLDIYGPVKDETYWNECMILINQMPYKVNYHGDIKPNEVQQTFSGYHASILLTKGENFGHALYESLSAGRPVITSKFTPWNDLVTSNAGWNVDIFNFSQCVAQLNAIKELNESELSKFYVGAYDLATDYFKRSNNIDNYIKLFSTTS